MNRVLVCLLAFFACSDVEAASVSVEACVSTVFTEVATGTDVAGFSSTCYPLAGEAEATDNINYKTASDSERREFWVGVCNFSGATTQYAIRHELQYAITKHAEEQERVNASIHYDAIPETATDGSGTFTRTGEFEIEDGICVDYVFNLTASYEVFSGQNADGLNSNHDVNGLFYDPENPGHGFDFNAHELGLTVYYYGHTADGQRLWLISDLVRGAITPYEPVTLEMYEIPAGTFGQPQGGAEYWGTIVLTLYGCDEADAVLDGKDGRLFMNLERIVGLSDSGCL